MFWSNIIRKYYKNIKKLESTVNGDGFYISNIILNCSNFGIVLKANNSTIDNITISADINALSIKNCNNTTITNNRLNSCHSDCYLCTIRESNFTKVYGNNFNECHYLLLIENVDNLIIDNNIFNVSAYGIKLDGDVSGVSLLNNMIYKERPIEHSCHSIGIFGKFEDISIIDNTIDSVACCDSDSCSAINCQMNHWKVRYQDGLPDSYTVDNRSITSVGCASNEWGAENGCEVRMF